jgi:hypothetical protein
MTAMEVTSTARYCYLTTTGRVTGRRRTVELWFVPADGGVFLMSGSGGLTQWCLDLEAEEQGVLRLDDRSFHVRAAEVVDEGVRAAALVDFHDKYDPPGRDRVSAWQANATVFRLVTTRELDL